MVSALKKLKNKARKKSTLRHPPKCQSQSASAELRYQVGSARVTGRSRSTHLVAGDGGFCFSSRIRVKGETAPNDSFNFTRSTRPAFNSFLFVHQAVEPDYSP